MNQCFSKTIAELPSQTDCNPCHGTNGGIELQAHVSAAYPFCGGTGREVVSLTTGYEQGSKDVLTQNLHTDLEDGIRLFFLKINTH